MLRISNLVSGGIITNYKCSSKCKHCAYSSSPEWPMEYMTGETADEIFKILRRKGCYSVHIGGGEPFLAPDKLLKILESAKNNDIDIEYVETNASWFVNEERTVSLLQELKQQGVYTLLISIDPFHNEFIPFSKVKGLIDSCRKVNMRVFPWMLEFWDELDRFDDTKTHSLDEYRNFFGEEYLFDLPKRYGLNLKGRAFNTFNGLVKKEKTDRIIKISRSCGLLSGVYHFHVDLYGNFIPQSCPGFSVKLKELVNGADPDKYKVLNSVESGGVGAQAELAVREFGYVLKDEYAGKCDLCYDIRKFLVVGSGLRLPDLEPAGHYLFM